jgi:hypothetical protein
MIVVTFLVLFAMGGFTFLLVVGNAYRIEELIERIEGLERKALGRGRANLENDEGHASEEASISGGSRGKL